MGERWLKGGGGRGGSDKNSETEAEVQSEWVPMLIHYMSTEGGKLKSFPI